MEIKQVKKDTERRSKTITVRTFPSYCEFMKKNDVSPSKLFNQAVKELMKEK